jgi:hypothetical protein
MKIPAIHADGTAWQVRAWVFGTIAARKHNALNWLKLTHANSTEDIKNRPGAREDTPSTFTALCIEEDACDKSMPWSHRTICWNSPT